ncbi:MAG: antibiotic biosynthesis monooxygenase [Chloroflexi bacterium]|nr:antibiotic biosynthesis monooxygenase [Chloroflexota bacterium]
MYAQVTHLRVPEGQIGQLRLFIEKEYLPNVSLRPGFIAAHLLEQIDDLDRAQLVIFWDSQQALENARHTLSLQGSEQSIAARLPGLRIERQGYIVRVTTQPQEAAAVARVS